VDDSSQLVAQFEKNSKEEVRVSIDDFRGRKLINIRVYYYYFVKVRVFGSNIGQ
jgi:hypothetical protein